ncbi:MAG: hypothetical protein NT098_02435 [Candidatus Parcubacteria bacterium]|nr:hypothetical protein [Candidatus Parcubacteria bacterium]
MESKNTFPKGSEWRKWDLHVHTPASFFWLGGKLLSFMNESEKKDSIKNFIDTVNNSDVEVFAIQDYWTFDWFFELRKYLQVNPGELKKTVFPGMELRVECPVNYRLNIHVLISDKVTDQQLKDFRSELKIRIGGITKNVSNEALIDFAKSLDSSKAKVHSYEDPLTLTDEKLLELGSKTAEVTKDSLTDAFKHLPEGSGFILLPYDTSDGLLNLDWRLHPQDDNYFMQTAHIFESRDQRNIDLFKGIKTTDNESFFENFFKTIGGIAKPCVSGSDAHKFSDYGKYPSNKITWIKADPTFEGLKQIIYEPSERVSVCPIEPNQKVSYKVIEKIIFEDSDDFPCEVVFNDNLCSVIGSRSSGKSALLAYIADAIDSIATRNAKTEGPGYGEKYHWDKIALKYTVYWKNGKTNKESPGKVIYIPQGYLFEKSEDGNEIKRKIEPVLFKKIPHLQTELEQSEIKINDKNQQIKDSVEEWFVLASSVETYNIQLKNLGDKTSVEKSKEGYENQIKKLKEENKLDEQDIKQYQAIRTEVSFYKTRIQTIDGELLSLSFVKDGVGYFSGVKVDFTPPVTTLPFGLQNNILEKLNESQSKILSSVNTKVSVYKTALIEEHMAAKLAVEKIKIDNNELIEKYKNNAELENLIKKLNENIETIKTIENTEKEIQDRKIKMTANISTIKKAIIERKKILEVIVSSIDGSDQSVFHDISFSAEYNFDDTLGRATQKINKTENTKFVKRNEVDIEEIRQNPDEFLSAIYSKDQKVTRHNDGKDVVCELLTLTEKVLLTAKMEGDKIGGFSESTMTPGKRALFALRLILAESDDTWPLLIDQPEDDLDSRSIYDEVVPFLKEKKKERQIIMVSHNANLVIGSDSEQVIVANRNGNDRKNSDGKQFNYLTGSLEFTSKKEKTCSDTLLSQGVCEHACEILDGGEQAFENRRNKYHIR